MKREIFYDDYANHLKGVYKDTYESMAIYIDAAMTPGDNSDEIMNEIVDLLLSAQSDNKNINDLIHNNLSGFCDQIIQSFAPSWLDRFFNFIMAYRIIALIALFIEGVILIVDYIDGIQNPWTSPVPIGGFLIALLCSLILVTIFKKFSKYAIIHFKWYTKKVNSSLNIIIFVSMFVGIIFIPQTAHEYITIPRWLFLPLMLCTFFIATKRKKYEKAKDIKEENNISFDEVAHNGNIERLRKKYIKYCKKCEKKNINIIEIEDWYEKDFKKEKLGDLLGRIFFILLVFSNSVYGTLTSTSFDAIMYNIINLGIAIPIYRFTDKGRIAREKVYKDIHERQTNILDDSLLIKGIEI